MTNMSALPSLKQTATIECPKSMVGRVIGKGGETIKALQQYTGAMIQIDQSQDPTKVTIAGTPSSLQLAVSMVNDIVCGHFKGFALLRQITSRSGTQQLAQPQPVYVEGYGFVPLSQQFTGDSGPVSPVVGGAAELSANEMLLIAAQQKYGLRSQSLPEPSGREQLAASELWAADPAAAAAAGLNLEHAKQLAQTLGLDTGIPSASAAPPVASLASLSLGLEGLNNTYDVRGGAAFDMAGGASQPHSPAASEQGGELPNGWMHISDPDGRSFFYNLLTKESRWKMPAGEPAGSPGGSW